jgi:dTDP-glucose 4,6-dehydratase
MKILVTGGCGFIGTNFIHHLLAETDYEIVNLDKLTYSGNPNNLKGIATPRYTFVKGDICDPVIVEKAMSGCGIVVNFAAESHVDRSISDAQPFIRSNFTGTYVLLEVARKLNVKRFVQIGTDEVYGSREKGSFTEKDRLEPSSPYSATKAAADVLALSYFTTHRLPVVVTRSSNNFGPYQYPEKLIPLFITNAHDSRKLPVYGDGLNVRDWLYVEDNCCAILLVMEKGKSGEIYNIGAGNEETNISITKKMLSLLEKPESLIEYVEDRKGHDRRYSIDSSKLKALGWAPKHEFAPALKETIKWYNDNEWWWRPLK